MRKWLVPLGVTCGVIVIGMAICIIATFLGIFRIAQSLPTPVPTPILTIGKNYWVNALVPPPGMPAGLVITNANVYNKPGNPITDPSVTIIAIIPDDTELTLTAVQTNWCYVNGKYYPLRQAGITDYSKSVVGWMECKRLLDYEPTPYPTPNKTPQAP